MGATARPLKLGFLARALIDRCQFGRQFLGRLLRPAGDKGRQLIVVFTLRGWRRWRRVLDLDGRLMVVRLIVVLTIVALMLLLRLLALAVDHFVIGRHLLLRPRLSLEPVALRVHHPEIMLGVLIEILRGNAVARRLRLAGQRLIALEHLIGVAADFDAGAVAVEGLRPLRRPRPAVLVVVLIRVAAAIAAARSLLWSHDTCLVAVNPVGPSSARMLGTDPLWCCDPTSYAARPNPSRLERFLASVGTILGGALRGSNHFLAGDGQPARRATTQRGIPARSGMMASIASPRAVISPATARSWPWPISPAKIPPLANRRGSSAEIAR